MEHTSFIELSKSALQTNVKFIRKMLGDTTYSAVVKGNAYGHGISNFVPLLYENEVRHYSVFSADEAFEVLSTLPYADYTIMIMGYIEDTALEWVIKNDIEFFVFDEERLRLAIKAAKKIKKTAKIHIEFETGMNRTGIDLKRFDAVMNTIKSNQKHIELVGICSHLAGAESIANYKRIRDQYKNFKKIQTKIKKEEDIAPAFHLACSAASIQYPKTRLDIARIGILQYGFFPSNEVLVQYMTENKTAENPLKRVISWKTKVMDLKMVKPGEFVGYGTSYFTNQLTKIALIPIGYSHGFTRSLSNRGKVLIKGQRFDVIGTVNMNMMAVDITDSANIERGDEVALIGRQGDLDLSVSSFSDFSDLVNYELLTRLPQKITRKIIA